MKTISLRLLLSSLLLSVLLFGCSDSHSANPEQETASGSDQLKEAAVTPISDQFYHYSIWYAFVNKVYDGLLSASELKQQGDLGLGSYNALDGELVMLNGELFRVTQDGKVSQPADDAGIVYANATFFDVDDRFSIPETVDYDALRERINAKLPTKNMFYAFRIHGTFAQMTCGGLHKQEVPYTEGLDVLIPARPVFERENFTGTMVGFYCPEFIGDINVAGYHLHFISDDKTFGGHVMSFVGSGLEVAMDEMSEYKFVLPDTKAYREVGFDANFQYEKQ